MKKSFLYAIRGIVSCVRNERNMRIHTAAAFYVILASVVTGSTAAQWVAVILCFALVMGAEMINTSVENVCDALHPEFSEKIKTAKDVAAGAVLICAAISAVVGGVIFFNREKIERAISFAENNVVLAALIILTVPFAVMYIIGRKKK